MRGRRFVFSVAAAANEAVPIKPWTPASKTPLLLESASRPHREGQPVALIHRYLDPSTSLAEILFGVIMTLTFTLSAGMIIEDEGRAGARELLIAVIGCNIAWGIIDAALFLVGQLFDRGRLRRLGRAIVTSERPG